MKGGEGCLASPTCYSALLPSILAAGTGTDVGIGAGAGAGFGFSSGSGLLLLAACLLAHGSRGWSPLSSNLSCLGCLASPVSSLSGWLGL